MDKQSDGIYISDDGWLITVTEGTRLGVWHYRASKLFNPYITGFVQAWDEKSAAELAALELKEKEK